MEITAYLTLLATLLSIYFPEELDPTLKPKDSSMLLFQNNEKMHFDFIIVGAGSAGCVVANRLSANPKWKVLLIEAGGDENYITDTPGIRRTFGNRFDWNFTSSPQQHACLNRGGHCGSNVARTMGGTSVMNGMMYVRGSAEDYDNWEKMGNPGWNYKSVLSYFLRAENITIPELVTSPYHSIGGPLSISYPKFRLPINEDFIKAGIEYGLKEIDYNGETQFGIGYTQYTIRDATRCSSSKAYLDPVRNRENLFIFKNTLALKILLNNEKLSAVGVQLNKDGRVFEVYAKKEVILSAGSFNTPRLLMLSGIGPKNLLEELNIPVLADLPVGKTLVDHAGVTFRYRINTDLLHCCREFTNETVLEYARDRKGELTAPNSQIIAYINGSHLPNKPVVQLSMGIDKFNNTPTSHAPHVRIVMDLHNPMSVGEYRIKSTDYSIHPHINPNYLSAKSDVEALKWAMRETVKYMSKPAMLKYSPKLMIEDVPQCLQYYSETMTDEFLECYMKYQGHTSSYHPVGTARMGPSRDKTSVVDSTLKVHTLKNVRVIDASVMPKIIRGNTNGPTIMIGEKGADIIINNYNTASLM